MPVVAVRWGGMPTVSNGSRTAKWGWRTVSLTAYFLWVLLSAAPQPESFHCRCRRWWDCHQGRRFPQHLELSPQLGMVLSGRAEAAPPPPAQSIWSQRQRRLCPCSRCFYRAPPKLLQRCLWWEGDWGTVLS